MAGTSTWWRGMNNLAFGYSPEAIADLTVYGSNKTEEMANVSENGSYDDPQALAIGKIARQIEFYCIPFICILGLLGNSLAAITFLKVSLRKTSCSLYLAARSISDNGFLVTLALIWISSTFDLRLSKVLGICQILVFFTYVFGCISVWLVVFLTVENYIRICHPFVVKRFCTTIYAKTTIAVLCVFVLAIYHIPLWISNPDCSPSPDYYEVTQAFVYTDSLLTLVFPTILMGLLIVAIIYNIALSFRRRDRMKQNQSTPNPRRELNQHNPMAQVTKMLFAVSLTFFVMNLPSHVIRLRLLINSFMQGYVHAPATEAAIQTVALLVYYLSLALNLVIYLIFGANFRKEFAASFVPKKLSNLCINRYEMVSSVREVCPRQKSTVIVTNAGTTLLTMTEKEEAAIDCETVMKV